MITEVFYPPDPTVAGATPGTSDNLSQRNLLILRTANPGSEITRTVQRSFDIDLTRRRQSRPAPDDHHPHHTRHGPVPAHGQDHAEPSAPRPARSGAGGTARHG